MSQYFLSPQAAFFCNLRLHRKKADWPSYGTIIMSEPKTNLLKQMKLLAQTKHMPSVDHFSSQVPSFVSSHLHQVDSSFNAQIPPSPF